MQAGARTYSCFKREYLMDRKKKLETISSVLNGLFSKRNWQKRVGLHQVFRFWDEAVGGDIADHARPAVIRGDVLWVEVSDSVWMQQLHLQKIDLLELLNRRLDDEKLADLRFQLARGRRKEEAHPVSFEAKPKVSVATERRKEFEALFGSVDDPEIRKSMMSLWEKSQTMGHDQDSK